MKVSAVGLPWYRKEQYLQLRALFADGIRLHETYAAWLSAARTTEARLLEEGYRVVRVGITPDDFLAWCSLNHVAADAQARMRYANEGAHSQKQFDDAGDEFVHRSRQTADLVERSVTPVFTYRDDGRMDFEGSGLFARLEERHYLVTAAHVFDACELGCVVRAHEDRGQPVEGSFIVTARPNGGSREDDPFDIGFVRLAEAEIEGIGPAAFLDLTHTLDQPSDSAEFMVALGFAVRDQTVERGIVRTKATTFTTGLESAHAYRVSGTNPRSHLLLRYRPKGTRFNGHHQGSAPSMQGLSGGGVWPVSLEETMPINAIPPLAGMVVERPDKYRTAIRATRAAALRAFIRKFDV